MKRGISLIVLVITIIILAILSVTAIVTVNNSEIISYTANAAFKGRVSTYIEELNYYHVCRKVIDNEYTPEMLNLGIKDEVEIASAVLMAVVMDPKKMTDVIPSMIEEDIQFFYIQAGELMVKETKLDAVKLEIAQELGVKINNTLETLPEDTVIEVLQELMLEYAIQDGEAIVLGFADRVKEPGSPAPVTELVIPDEIEKGGIKYPVTSIGNMAFIYCDNLNSIILPDSIDVIGAQAFERCSSLTSVIMPERAISMGKAVFSFCSSLSSITIPEGVLHIRMLTFAECNNLVSASIPRSVTKIGPACFYTKSLSDIYYFGTKEEWSKIERSSTWNFGAKDIVVHCIDGDIVIGAWGNK